MLNWHMYSMQCVYALHRSRSITTLDPFPSHDVHAADTVSMVWVPGTVQCSRTSWPHLHCVEHPASTSPREGCSHAVAPQLHHWGWHVQSRTPAAAPSTARCTSAPAAVAQGPAAASNHSQ